MAMAVDWTPHRFSGGVLALDAANTVVHRGRPDKSFDRFDDRSEIGRFAEAAGRFRSDEVGGRPLMVGDCEAAAPRVLAIREATDRLFRHAAACGEIDKRLLPDLLRACADGIEAFPADENGRDAARPIAFEAALAVSALSLLPGEAVRRLRICPNCGWLFLDRSRNASRMWCDMTVCGNRNKARLHYRRRKAASEEVSHA